MAVFKSDRFRKIGERVREELFPLLQGCRIAWLVSDKPKASRGKTVFAECKKYDKEKLAWLSDESYDFTITVYEPNCEDWYFDDAKYAILLEHELMHVGYDPVTGDCTLVPHDAEEFRAIIQKYGIDWAEPIEKEPESESKPESESEAEPEAEL